MKHRGLPPKTVHVLMTRRPIGNTMASTIETTVLKSSNNELVAGAGIMMRQIYQLSEAGWTVVMVTKP